LSGVPRRRAHAPDPPHSTLRDQSTTPPCKEHEDAAGQGCARLGVNKDAQWKNLGQEDSWQRVTDDGTITLTRQPDTATLIARASFFALTRVPLETANNAINAGM
jgi:hypothetical protein